MAYFIILFSVFYFFSNGFRPLPGLPESLDGWHFIFYHILFFLFFCFYFFFGTFFGFTIGRILYIFFFSFIAFCPQRLCMYVCLYREKKIY